MRRSTYRRLARLAPTALIVLIANLPLVAQESIVDGITEIASGGASGAVYPETTDWFGIAGGDADASFPSLYVAGREYGAGRVIAVGHEGLLANSATLDNGDFLVNALEWLDEPTGTGEIRATSGHGEFAAGGALSGLTTLADAAGLNLVGLGGTVTTAALDDVSVLIVGNAWGDFTAAEIEAIEEFVDGGGGLLLAGLGWSWVSSNPDETLEDYPMIQLAEPYGIRWLTNIVSDPTDSTSGSTIFSVFYPDVGNATLADAISTIEDAHVEHGADLPAELEIDSTLRLAFARAHILMSIPTTDLPAESPARTTVYDSYVTWFTDWPDFYARGFSFDETLTPTAAHLRERAWRSWRDALPLDSARKDEIADLGDLTGTRLDIFETFDLILMDNDRLGESELTLIEEMRGLIPTGLDPLQAISVRDYLGTPPETIALRGSRYSVNVFGVEIGQFTENPFPADVPAYTGDLFASVLAHELNHVVDAVDVVEAAGELRTRRDQLIEDAGTEPLNYLRSMIGAGFFVTNPQEFVASISNQYLNDSQTTLDLGLIRFDDDRPDPINQVLFFADMYSAGGDTTYFYLTTSAGEITRQPISIGRDSLGRLVRLVTPTAEVEFTLSTAGRVTAYTLTEGTPFVRGDVNADGARNVADAVTLLDDLFLGGSAPCSRAGDTNGDGVLELADAVALLDAMFAGGTGPAAPFPDCGVAEDGLPCAAATCP